MIYDLNGGVHMSILSIGIDIGRREGEIQGMIIMGKQLDLTDSEIILHLCKSFHLDTDTAEKMFHDFSCHD